MGTEERKSKERQMKQKDIIEAAERVFFSKGYKNASMDEVAKEAQYSKRTVYVYFNSKEQIYYKIMIRGYRLLIDTIEKDRKEKAPQNAVEELRSIFFTFFRFKSEHADYYKAIMEYETNEPDEQAGIENEARKECYRLGEQIFGYLGSALQKGVAEGSLRKGIDLEQSALVLWACMVGVFITGEKKEQYLREFHHTDTNTFVTSAFDLIISSISSNRGDSL